MKKIYGIKTKIGSIGLVEEKGFLVNILFNYTRGEEEQSDLLLEAEKQIKSYLDGRLKKFDLPYQAKGSVFQKKIWAILETIPYGQTWTYQQVAVKAENPQAARAVGGANHHNPLPIIIPCHRVIGANGGLVGYGGGLTIKESLLKLETDNQKGPD